MAMSLSQQIHWLTSGLEEMDSIVGTPVVDGTNPPSSGNLPFSCNIDSSVVALRIAPTGIDLPTTTDPTGPSFAYSFDIRFSASSPSTDGRLVRCTNNANDAIGQTQAAIYWNADGSLSLRNALEAIEEDTNASPGIVPGTWQKLVFSVFKHNTLGIAKVWLDGVLILSGENIDTNSGNPRMYLSFTGFSGAEYRIGGITMLWDATDFIDEADGLLIGGYEYNYVAVSGTGFSTDGDPPDAGVWSDTGNLPIDAATVLYSSTIASGRAVTNGTIAAGPLSAGLSGTVRGVAYCFNGFRGGGPAGTHEFTHGKYNSGVYTTINTPVVLAQNTATPGVILVESDAGTHVPSLTDYAAVGVNLNASRDMEFLGVHVIFLLEPSAGNGDQSIFITDLSSGTDSIASISVGLGIADSAAGADSFGGLAATLTVPDSSVALDLITALLVNFTVSEISSALETLSVDAQTNITDSGSVLELITALTTLSVTDSGSGTDFISTSQFFNLFDTATAVDLIALVTATLSVSDLGLSSDTVASLAGVNVTDSASALEAITVITDVVISITDTAIGSDNIATILASLSILDIALGTETVSVSQLVTIVDSLVVIEATTVTVFTPVTDSITATEAVNVEAGVSVTDVGQGVDVVTLEASVSVSDLSTSSELVTVLTAVLISIADAASGTDTVNDATVSLTVNDTGTALESLLSTTLLAVLDSANATDVIITTTPGTTYVTFTLPQRKTDFTVPGRKTTLLLKPRGKIE